MAKIGTVQNGLKAKSNGIKKKSNPLNLARVKGFAKKNGLKLMPKGTGAISKIAANPKHHKKGKKKKNGGLTSGLMTRRNGILGNTKSDAKKVGSLLGGMLGGKALARFLQSFVAPYLASTGLGNYAEILSDGAVALFIAPLVAGKLGGAEMAQFARLGALGNVVVDIIEMIAPNTLSMFGVNPLVSNGQQVGLSPAAVTAIVNSTNASPDNKAKVAGAMAQLNSGVVDYAPAMQSAPMMPLYN